MRIVGATYERGCKYVIMVCPERSYCACNLACPTGKTMLSGSPWNVSKLTENYPFPYTSQGLGGCRRTEIHEKHCVWVAR
jgi:hypothetical protein